jgi:hypothetical protein
MGGTAEIVQQWYVAVGGKDGEEASVELYVLGFRSLRLAKSCAVTLNLDL